MTQAAPQTIYLKDYTAPAYNVITIDLRFELGEEHTDVCAVIKFERSSLAPPNSPLYLHGRDLELVGLRLDAAALPADAYHKDDEGLTVLRPPASGELQVETRIYPQRNKALEGLYQSSANFCTQCEAEGFRKITYYPDRPDVMAIFTTTVVADRTRYPVLLSNGNLTDRGELENNRHWVTWNDPHRKPSYLFALVAGQLECVKDQFITRSGRAVSLEIYVEPENRDQCAHAMRSLQKAMQWDEQTYGLEYDLDTYMIVAVGDFNMGAMENKGLNIFNTKYVLAKPETATDTDFAGVEGVIAHEYFHNWTGNRVTCRDWFQLSLKEGLTVFRDQEFSADMGSRSVQRIDDVRLLRAVQFPEDAGPMAHSVRPDSYMEINNFYTATVYNKGAEVVRMIHTLVGKEGFRRGMDLYIERHDGQAVTCDDFVAAMEAANDIDLQQFRRWYSQAGTPQVRIDKTYDAAASRYTITATQSCPATPNQPDKKPFHIPLTVGLVDPDGAPVALQLEGENTSSGTSRTLELIATEQQFHFINVAREPIPSVRRGFSAPVNLDVDYSDTELSFLLAHDDNEFNRWEAGQQLASRTILNLVDTHAKGKEWSLNPVFADAFAKALVADIDPALRAQLLTLPAESFLIEQAKEIDVDNLFAARQFLRRALAEHLHETLLATYDEHHDNGDYVIDGRSIGKRALKNVCLSYLMQRDGDQALALCLKQLHGANNMTDELGALMPLASRDCPERDRELDAFYQRWSKEQLVVDKWFAMQATSTLPDTLTRVKALQNHSAYSIENPNKVRALVGAFSHGNLVRFHAADGSGYVFLADQILRLNDINPQTAARLVGAFSRWRRFDLQRQASMCRQLERLRSAPDLSADVFEVVSKSLPS